MNEALGFILSAEDQWSHDDGSKYIKFNKDGTGELWCRCEFVVFIAADLEWKIIESREPRPITTATKDDGPRLLGQLELEIALFKRIPEYFRSTILAKSAMINELGLTDEAFQTKSYSVRIEQGNFVEPSSTGYTHPYKSRFALRLLFNKSPYPPRSEWKNPEGGPDSNEFWNYKEFVSQCSPHLKTQGPAMNDISAQGWNSCVVM